MRRLALIVTVAVCSAAGVMGSPTAVCAPPGASLAGSPIARAEKGDVQCYQPDTTKKTCQSIADYKRLPDGTIQNVATVLVGLKPVVVMQTATTVTIRNGQVCGPIKQADIDGATFTVNGAPATAKQAELLRKQMTDSMATLLNADICTAYLQSGNSFTARETVDGASQPNLDQHVIWVAQADGYKVAP